MMEALEVSGIHCLAVIDVFVIFKGNRNVPILPCNTAGGACDSRSLELAWYLAEWTNLNTNHGDPIDSESCRIWPHYSMHECH